jgi:hypothetical protein
MRAVTDRRREKCKCCFFRRLAPSLATAGLRLRSSQLTQGNFCGKCDGWLRRLESEPEERLFVPGPVSEAEDMRTHPFPERCAERSPEVNTSGLDLEGRSLV